MSHHYASHKHGKAAAKLPNLPTGRVFEIGGVSLSRSPVVLLVYNRPELTRRVLDVVEQARPGKLYVVCDGPVPHDVDDKNRVSETRALFADLAWKCEVVRIYSDHNLGLKKRIVSGLTEVFTTTDRAVILEDDCVPDLTFFDFCDELLTRYALSSDVGIISGASRLRGHAISSHSYDFSEDLRIWGWATWGRTWNAFVTSGDVDARWSPGEQQEIVESLPAGARRKNMRTMLRKAEELDSWALPFAVHFRKSGYVSAVPAVNLVENVGFGEGSTHTRFEDYVAEVPASAMPLPLVHPETTEAHPHLDALESQLDRRERWVYPLLHPIDAFRRFFRFGIDMLRTQ